MSFILDALKKLEQKKQDASVPDLLTVHTAEQYESGKRSFWPIIVIALLLLNAGIVSYWMLSDKTEDGVVAEVDTHENQKVAVPPESKKTVNREISDKRAVDLPVQADVKEAVIEKAADKIVDTDETPEQPPVPENTLVQKEAWEAVPVESTAEITDAEDETPLLDQLVKEASGDTVEMTTLQPETAGNADTDQDTALPSEVHPLSAVESNTEKQLPTIRELPADVRKEIPDLTIIAHIYSNDPSSRMININGNVLREGDTLSGSLTVEEITVSGVTFNYKDHLFRLRAF